MRKRQTANNAMACHSGVESKIASNGYRQVWSPQTRSAVFFLLLHCCISFTEKLPIFVESFSGSTSHGHQQIHHKSASILDLRSSKTSLPKIQRQHRSLLKSTTTNQGSGILDEEFQVRKKNAISLLKENKSRKSFLDIRELVTLAEKYAQNQEYDAQTAAQEVDQILQTFTSRMFAPPYRENGARNRIMLGMDAITLQLSSKLPPPYNTVPKIVFVNALRALTGLNEVQQPQSASSSSLSADSSYSAFRILQRLVTGVGIRRKNIQSQRYRNDSLKEQDFNMVLNSFSSTGQMDMAHKIVALQERTEHAPPLSPVAYSILLKGYGRLGDLQNVDMIMKHAKADGIVPDTVMLNSLVDAYVNCDAIEKAQAVFHHMTDNAMEECKIDCDTVYWVENGGAAAAKANRRTYNTMLKGLAKRGLLDDCLSLSRKMEQSRLWDDITTNTLVHAAVVKRDFSLAETLLKKYTSANNGPDNWRRGRHPNVEAYTELLDGYSKFGELNKAIQVMQTMKNRGVVPNEYTYTCLVAALARHGRVEEAKKMMKYMENVANVKPNVVTYNAFISALVSTDQKSLPAYNPSRVGLSDEKVDDALGTFYEMMRSGVRPNDVTISTLVTAFGDCRPNSRVKEAKSLVARLEKNGLFNPAKNDRVATALIQSCGSGNDVLGAIDCFRKLQNPSLVAVNSVLHACVRCNEVQIALKTFRRLFHHDSNPSSSQLEPDLITYTVLICGLLKQNTMECSKEAHTLYLEMKKIRSLHPDNAMVDQ